MQATITQITYCILTGVWSMDFTTPEGRIETILLNSLDGRYILNIWPHVTKEKNGMRTYTIIQNPQLNRKS